VDDNQTPVGEAAIPQPTAIETALAEYRAAEQAELAARRREREARIAKEAAADARAVAERLELAERYLGTPMSAVKEILRVRADHLAWEAKMMSQITEHLKAIPARDRKRLDPKLLAATSIPRLTEARPSKARKTPPSKTTPKATSAQASEMRPIDRSA
jgi:hypothetical protein